MNSRERLLKVLAHEIPDRVPISTYELVGFNSISFENRQSSYKQLMDMIRDYTDCVCMWDLDSNPVFLNSSYPAQIESVEIRDGLKTTTKNTLHTDSLTLTQTLERADDVNTVWQTEHWCKSTEDVDALLRIPFEPLKFSDRDYKRIAGELDDNGIVMSTVADPLLLAADLMKFEDFTVWALTEREHFKKTVEIFHERNMENLRRMLSVKVVDLYRICGPEYATPPYLPPDCFLEFVVPYVKEMTELIHSKGGKVRIHCHGKIASVLRYMLDTGVDAIDPCEPPPDGDIELSEIKKIAGDNLTLFGNIELYMLENKSQDEVREAVRKCMYQAKEGGNFIIMPTASPINIPLSKKTEENYFTFIETSLEYGKY